MSYCNSIYINRVGIKIAIIIIIIKDRFAGGIFSETRCYV